jgi:hypothetical protein
MGPHSRRSRGEPVRRKCNARRRRVALSPSHDVHVQAWRECTLREECLGGEERRAGHLCCRKTGIAALASAAPHLPSRSCATAPPQLAVARHADFLVNRGKTKRTALLSPRAFLSSCRGVGYSTTHAHARCVRTCAVARDATCAGECGGNRRTLVTPRRARTSGEATERFVGGAVLVLKAGRIVLSCVQQWAVKHASVRCRVRSALLA